MKARPVPAENQWRLWPRIARPFECRTCGRQYACTFDAEVESKARQSMREFFACLGARTFVHDRVPRFRFCRDDGCDRFFDYDLESELRDQGRSSLIRHPRLPMRKRWLPMPRAANGAH